MTITPQLSTKLGLDLFSVMDKTIVLTSIFSVPGATMTAFPKILIYALILKQKRRERKPKVQNVKPSQINGYQVARNLVGCDAV
jgi:hypothetical protein